MAENDTPKGNAVDPNNPAKKSPTASPEDSPAKQTVSKKKVAPAKKTAPQKKAAPKKKASPKKKAATKKQPAPKRAIPSSTPKPAQDSQDTLENKDTASSNSSKTETRSEKNSQPAASERAARGSTKRSRVLPWISLIVLIAIATYLFTGPLGIRTQRKDQTSPALSEQKESTSTLPAADDSQSPDKGFLDKRDEATALTPEEPEAKVAESEADDVGSALTDLNEYAPTASKPIAPGEFQGPSEREADKPAAELATADTPQPPPTTGESAESQLAETDGSRHEATQADTATTTQAKTPQEGSLENESIYTRDPTKQDPPAGNDSTSSHDQTLESNSKISRSTETSQPQNEGTRSNTTVSGLSDEATSQGQLTSTDKENGLASEGETLAPVTAQHRPTNPEKPNLEREDSTALSKDTPASQSTTAPPASDAPLNLVRPYNRWYPYRQTRRNLQRRRYYNPHYFPNYSQWQNPYLYGATRPHRPYRPYYNQ